MRGRGRRASRTLNAAFRQLGSREREPAMTQEQAAMKLEQLSRDMGFRERMFANDASARAEWSDLVRTAAGSPSCPFGTDWVTVRMIALP